MNIYKYFVLISFLLIISCDPNRVYEDNTNIEKNKWLQQNSIEFQVDIKDTVSAHNIYVNIRNTGKYPMSNIFLFIKTSSPLGYSVIDTFNCILADEKGKWLGKGFGNIWNNRFLYKKNVKFPIPGTYTFRYEQAMRKEELLGIVDVGLRIEKVIFK